MRFLHVGDLHIGRRLNGHGLLEDQKQILVQLVELAHSCDAVLLAGDLYDKAQPASEAIRLVGDFFVALSRLGKPVFAVSGNHDSAEQVAYCRELLGASGVFVSPAFDGKLHKHVLHDECGEVHVWLLPFVRPASVRPFFPNVHTFDEAVRAALGTAERDPQARHVLVAHQYVSGAEICESETRLIGGLDAVGVDAFEGFDYVALGHLHSPQKLCGGRVCYSGSIMKYSLSEEDQKKAALVIEMDGQGQLRFEEHPLSPMHDLRTVRGKLEEISAPENRSEDYIYAVLTDEELVLDALGALRMTYPRLLGMRVQNSRSNEEAAVLEEMDAEALTPMEHFVTFYQAQNHGQAPDEKRVRMMEKLFEEAGVKLYASDET